MISWWWLWPWGGLMFFMGWCVRSYSVPHWQSLDAYPHANVKRVYEFDKDFRPVKRDTSP